MPLARLVLRNEYGLGDPELYRNAAAGKDCTKVILDGVAVAGLVGILRQLGDVAEFGAEIFHDMHEQVMQTSARGHKILSRIKKIEETLPSIEDTIRRKGSYIDLAYENGSGWRSDLRIMDSHLSCGDLPQFMMDSYEECRDPPRLYLLDKYDRAGIGACLKRYSDPSYFKRAWATLEPKKAQKIQKEQKLQKIKRKYSRHRDGEVQDPISTSQCNSLTRSPWFAPPTNGDRSFSAENSSVSEMKLKDEVTSEPQHLNTMSKLNCTGQVSKKNHPSVMPNDIEYDRLSVSNLQNNHDHPDASHLYSDDLVLGVDDDSQYDFLHRKSTSWSPSVIWDEKSELVKAAGLKFSDNPPQDSNPLLVNSESSQVEQPAGTRSMGRAKCLPIIADFPGSSCDQNQFEEFIDADNYVDALNTLESEAETDFECQTKCIQYLSNLGLEKNETGLAKMPQYYRNSITEVPKTLHDSSNKCMLPSDTYLDFSRTLEPMQTTQEAGLSPGSPCDGSQLFENSVLTMSRANAFQVTDDDQPPWSTDIKSVSVLNNDTIAATSQIQISPPISISNIPSTKLWTNGNLLGLEPSKPLDITLSSRDGERNQSNTLNNGVESDKQNTANGKISKQLDSIGEVRRSPESLTPADQRILNSNQFFSKKYVVEENSSMKHSSTCLGSKYNASCAKQNSQEQSETLIFSEREGSKAVSPNVLSTSISQVHQSTNSASSKESEPCNAFSVASLSMDSVQDSKYLSPSFSGLPQSNLVQCLQIGPSGAHTENSVEYEPENFNDSQSGEKPLVNNLRKRLNGVASQAFYEQNLAPRTFHEQSLINKTDYELLEKSISPGSPYSQNSSPPLEHMKVSFHPMNGLEASNLKLELPDGCINERMDGNAFPSFCLLPGCTLPIQDDGSESDDDTFCRSYPYSTDDLLSPRSVSNSELWEHDDCSESKINDLYDDLRRISTSTASISRCNEFEQMNPVDQEIGLKDICTRNDTASFQPGYITNIPSFESLITQNVKSDCLSISPKNATTLPPIELPPPPPLPPLQWRLLRPLYEISEENYCNIAQAGNYFEGHLNQNPPAPVEIENIIRRSPPLALAEDGWYKKMQDNPKLDSLLQTNLSSNPYELDRREHLLHQIRDMDIQHKLKPCENSKSQVTSCEGVDKREDLLHQIKTKRFNLRRTSTSRLSFVRQPNANDKVAAILEKANAIRQACASSDEENNWSDD